MGSKRREKLDSRRRQIHRSWGRKKTWRRTRLAPTSSVRVAEHTTLVEDARRRGLIPINTRNGPCDTVMGRALETLGVPVLYNRSTYAGVLLSTPDGQAMADILIAANAMFCTTFAGLARRFRRQPEVLSEFGAAHKLGAPRDVLKGILEQLWRR